MDGDIPQRGLTGRRARGPKDNKERFRIFPIKLMLGRILQQQSVVIAVVRVESRQRRRVQRHIMSPTTDTFILRRKSL